MFRRRRLLVWYYGSLAGLVLLIAAVAVGVYAFQRLPSPGTLVLLASAGSASHLSTVPVSVQAGNGWEPVGSTAAQAVPAAPDNTTLLEANVGPGEYDAVRVGHVIVRGWFRIDSGRVTPVLVTVAAGGVEPSALYVGADQLNLALAELSGRLKPVPPFALKDQLGRPFTNTQIAGHDVVLAAFHTTCHVTCPLYTGLFLRLRKLLPASVILIEATTDPRQDSPAILRDYAERVGADWTFLTGAPAQMEAFWAPFTVQLSGAQLHSSTIALIDSHGYIRTYYQGVPRLSGLPAQLRQDLDSQGVQELGSGGDGWGGAQISDALSSIDSLGTHSPNGGGMATPFNLPGLFGGRVSLASLRGRPVVINFWASYCAPCRSEMPMIVRETSKHPDIRVLFVDESDSSSAAAAFIKQLGIRDPVLVDSGGGVGDQYGLEGLPMTDFVSAAGSVEGRYIGQISAQILDEHLADLERL